MRIRTVVPESLPHRVTKDFEIAGYKVKENSLLIPCLYNICHSDKYWSNPEAFQPERFLNWDSKSLSFAPFGYGPRICAGLKIAKVDLFYFLTFLFQKFEFYSTDTNFQIPSWTHRIVLSPNKFSFKIKRR